MTYLNSRQGPDKIPDDSNNEYNRYGKYNKYSEHDSDYYYRNKKYERKTSLMMSSIISLVIV